MSNKDEVRLESSPSIPPAPSVPPDMAIYLWGTSRLTWRDISSALSEFQDVESSITLVAEPNAFEASFGSLTLTGNVVPPSLESAKRLAEKALAALVDLNDELSNEV